jgi:protein TonB
LRSLAKILLKYLLTLALIAFGLYGFAQNKKAAGSGPSASKKSATEVFRFVEQMPEFDGSLNAYLGAHMTYPPAALKDSIEGRSIVQFVVNEDGSVTDVAVMKSAGNGDLDSAAVDAVRSMPNWKPGKQEGKPVRVYFTLPITFRLD